MCGVYGDSQTVYWTFLRGCGASWRCLLRCCRTGAAKKSADDSHTGPRRGGVTDCRGVRVCARARACERWREGARGRGATAVSILGCQIVCACEGARGRERAREFIHKSLSSVFDVGSGGPARTCVFDIQQLRGTSEWILRIRVCVQS